MKTALLGDIHGNNHALEAVLHDIHSDDSIDDTYHLGDLVNYGALNNEVVARIIQEDISGVMGNHDNAASNDLDPVGWGMVPIFSLIKTRDLLHTKYRDFLAALPRNLELDSNTLLVHGAPPDDFNTYFHPEYTKIQRLQKIMDSMRHKIVFVAHTHKLLRAISANNLLECYHLDLGVTELDDTRSHVLSVGSVGQPRDRIDTRAKYAVYDSAEKTVEIRAVEYDTVAAAQAIIDAGYPYNNAKRLFMESEKHRCPPDTH